MNTRCLCAEQRASESAAHIDRLNARVDALRRQWREQMDITDTARVQVGELRRLLDQERESKLAMVAALDESMAREEAMREAFIALSTGTAQAPLRSALQSKDGVTMFMPAGENFTDPQARVQVHTLPS